MFSFPEFATDIIQSDPVHLINFMGLPNLVRMLYIQSLIPNIILGSLNS
jgi:hypothetical protein